MSMANVQLLPGSSCLQLEKFKIQPLLVSATWGATHPTLLPDLHPEISSLVQTSGSPQTKQPHPVIFESSLSFLGLRKHVRTYKRRNAGEVSISLCTRSTTDKDWHKFASLEEISSGLDHNKRLQSGIPLEILWLLSYPQDKNPLFVFVCPAL